MRTLFDSVMGIRKEKEKEKEKERKASTPRTSELLLFQATVRSESALNFLIWYYIVSTCAL